MTDSEPSRRATRKNPEWFGRRYPRWEDLERLADDQGCLVIMSRGRIPSFHPGDGERAPAIFIPEGAGHLERFWMLAHELGHLQHHVGPRAALLYSKGEHQASQWAAQALIPQARIRAYANASLDAFIGALSAHYEDLPLWDCPARRLAADIARIRLRAVEEVA